MKYSFNLCLPGSYSVKVIYTSFRCPHLSNQVAQNHPSALDSLVLVAAFQLNSFSVLVFYNKIPFCFGELV